MPVGTVILTPGCPAATCGVPTLDLRAYAYADDEWVARVALDVAAAGVPAEPLLLVLAGHHAQNAPALGFAQRAARRSIAGYVLVDPVLPVTGAADWPDAPVTVVITDRADEDARSSALTARLRGWQVHTGDLTIALDDVLRES